MRDRTSAYINANMLHSFSLIPHNILLWKNLCIFIMLEGKKNQQKNTEVKDLQHLDVAWQYRIFISHKNIHEWWR